MRVLHCSLLASLAVNGLLGFAYVVGRSSDQTTGRSATAPIPTIAGAVVSTDADTTPPSWESLSQELSPALVARLRAEGFPPEAVRAIVTHLLDEQFSERRKAFRPPPRGYWQSDDYFAYSEVARHLSPEQMAARRALDQEYRQALDALLGNERDPVQAAWERHQYGDLPPAKVASIKAINADYVEIGQMIRAATKGLLLPEDERKLAYLEEEKRADLAALLTPEEMLAYELRGSSTANGLRSQLARFEPSEKEFIALFHVQREVERELAALPHRPNAVESRELRENKIRDVLSPERFDDYQVRTSGSYPWVQPLVQSLELPESTIGDVIRTQRDFSREANIVLNDPNLTSAERQAKLAEIAGRAHSRIQGSLGTEGTREYLGTPAAKWLLDIAPTTPPKD
jgi:hypothetical protein